MRRTTLARVALALAGVALAAAALAKAVPYLTGRVNDLADLLPAEVESRLEEKLARLESATGAQVAVLTVEGLGGEDLEGYALEVAETWKLGRGEGRDDGALLLVARDDRKMRLEVGYGLEPKLTDALSRRILDDVLRPRFREGDFAGGIEGGVDAIAAAIEGRPAAVEEVVRASPGEQAGEAPLPARIAFFAFFIAVVGMFSLAAVFTDGCGGWFLYAFLLPFWTAFPLAIWGLPVGAVFPLLWAVGFPVAWLLLRRTERGRSWRTASPWARRFTPAGGGGWVWGSGGSSGRSWSSGGFSGGGGRFGGGGASSSW